MFAAPAHSPSLSTSSQQLTRDAASGREEGDPEAGGEAGVPQVAPSNEIFSSAISLPWTALAAAAGLTPLEPAVIDTLSESELKLELKAAHIRLAAIVPAANEAVALRSRAETLQGSLDLSRCEVARLQAQVDMLRGQIIASSVSGVQPEAGHVGVGPGTLEEQQNPLVSALSRRKSKTPSAALAADDFLSGASEDRSDARRAKKDREHQAELKRLESSWTRRLEDATRGSDETIADLQRRIASSASLLAASKQTITDLQEDVKSADAKVSQLEAALAAAKRTAEDAQVEALATSRQAADLRASLVEAQRDLASVRSVARQGRDAEAAELARRYDELEARAASVDDESNRIAELENSLADARARQEQLEGELTIAREELDRVATTDSAAVPAEVSILREQNAQLLAVRCALETELLRQKTGASALVASDAAEDAFLEKELGPFEDGPVGVAGTISPTTGGHVSAMLANGEGSTQVATPPASSVKSLSLLPGLANLPPFLPTLPVPTPKTSSVQLATTTDTNLAPLGPAGPAHSTPPAKKRVPGVSGQASDRFTVLSSKLKTSLVDGSSGRSGSGLVAVGFAPSPARMSSLQQQLAAIRASRKAVSASSEAHASATVVA
jgi:hypothetical protein